MKNYSQCVRTYIPTRYYNCFVFPSKHRKFAADVREVLVHDKDKRRFVLNYSCKL